MMANLNIPAMAGIVVTWANDTGKRKEPFQVRNFVEETLGDSINNDQFAQLMQYLHRQGKIQARANSQKPYQFV
jgi:hypothetical protein